eukprot:Skav200894  [mRNA]  locus=scaffold1581:127353:129642:- [translate_table: standard]
MKLFSQLGRSSARKKLLILAPRFSAFLVVLLPVSWSAPSKKLSLAISPLSHSRSIKSVESEGSFEFKCLTKRLP